MWNRDELYGPAKAVFKWRAKQVRVNHLIDDTKGKCYEDDTEEAFFKVYPSIVLCEDVRSGSHSAGKEIGPADFWDYLYSKTRGKDCSLRIMDGQLLEMILTTLLIFERDQIVGMHNIYCYTTTTRQYPICLREGEMKVNQQKEILLVDFTYYGIRRAGPVPDKESTHFLPDINASASGLCSAQQFSRTSPERFICREPRSVRHEGDLHCLDSGLLGISGPIRTFPLPAIDCTIPALQSAHYLVKLFRTDRQELLPKPVSQTPPSRRQKKVGDKIPDILPFHLATKAIEPDVIGWDLDRCSNTRHAQGDMLYVTDELLRKAPEKAADRLKKLLRLKEKNRWLKRLEKTTTMEKSSLSIDYEYEEIKPGNLPIIKPLRGPLDLVDYLRYLERQDRHQRRRHKKGKGKKGKNRGTPSMRNDDTHSGLSSKSPGHKAHGKTGEKHKSGVHGKTGAAHGKATDESIGGIMASPTASPTAGKRSVHVTIIEADNRRFAEEVGGVTDSVATKNYLLDLYTHPLKMGESLDAMNYSEEQTFLHGTIKTGKSLKMKSVNLMREDHAHERDTQTLSLERETQTLSLERETQTLSLERETQTLSLERETQTLTPPGMNADCKHGHTMEPEYVVDAHKKHTHGMKMLIGTHRHSVLSSPFPSTSFTESYVRPFDTDKLNQQYSHEKFGAKSKKEMRLERLRKSIKSNISPKTSEIISPPEEEEEEEEVVIHQPTPEPTVLGKLKKREFLQYRDYKPMVPEVTLPDFSVYPMQDFVKNLLRALEDFVVRKEIISSSYEKRALTTVTFTRHEVFVHSLSKL